MLVFITASATTFVWYSNRLQTASGARLRASVALQAAEAGVHRAVAILETVAPDGQTRGREWRTDGYSETLRGRGLDARFSVTVGDGPGGSVVITSTGEAGGRTRRLRAHVHLASPALLVALYGASVVHLERPPASIVVLPYGAGVGDRPWIQIAAGREIGFATADVSINDPSHPFEIAAGPADRGDPALRSMDEVRPGPVRVLLARDAGLTIGSDRQRVNVQQLRAMGIYLDGVVIHREALPPLPSVDRTYYRGLAAANTVNAAVNAAAGRYFGDDALTRKRDSLYEHVDFERVMAFLATGRQAQILSGIVYLRGGLSLVEGQRLRIVDGGLIAESSVFVDEGASLEVTHTAATRALPGIVVLDDGALVVTRRGRLRVHGLVYVNRMIDLGVDARIDIVGGVAGNDPEISFRNYAASVVIRYDPAIMGTPGLRVPDASPVAGWVAAWEELP
jgi:hypothetical protein